MFSNYFFLNLMIKFGFLQIANPVVRGNSKNTIEHGQACSCICRKKLINHRYRITISKYEI